MISGCRAFDTLFGEGAQVADTDSRVLWHTSAYQNQGLPWYDGQTVYFQGFAHEVTAVDKATGAVRWSVTLPVDRQRTVGRGGHVVGDIVIVGDQDLFALSAADGSIRWRFAPSEGVDIGRLVPVVWNGLVIAGSSNGYVFAVDVLTGERRWTTQLSTGSKFLVFTSPVVDGSLYITTVDWDAQENREPQGGVGALDAATGVVLWLRDIPHHVNPTGPTATISPVAVGSVVVAGARDGPIYGFDRFTGEQRWKMPPLPFPPLPPPYVREEGSIRDHHWLATCGGTVFAGSSSTIVVRVEPETGREVWRTPATNASAEWIWCDDELVYVFRPLGQLEVLHASTGARRWAMFGAYDFWFGAAAERDRVFAGGRSGLYALRRD